MANARLGWFSPLGVAFRFGDCPRRVGASARWVGLRAHCFRFSARTASGLPSASWPSGSLLPLFGMHRFGVAARRVGLRAHGFRFSARTASELPSASWRFRSAGWPSGSRLLLFGMRRFGVASAGWPSDSRLPLFGTHRFGVALGGLVLPLVGLVFPPSASEIALGGLAFGLTASAFRHVPIRGCRWASWPSGSLLRRLPSASWPSDSLLPLFGLHRSAPQRRRSEGRRSTTTRQLFHFKTLIPTC